MHITENLKSFIIYLQYQRVTIIPAHSHTLIFTMQYEPITDKKRKFDNADSYISTELPQENFMFLQIIHEYPYNCLVKIDPMQDKSIYEDLLEFEKSKITIQMNNYELESLYTLYPGNVCHPETHTTWLEFFHNNSLRKTSEKSQHIILDRENLHKIQKAHWFVSFCSR